jgi:diguanylate cyclase (GGDEF)-like protein/PAS domain S-box-containing protein
VSPGVASMSKLTRSESQSDQRSLHPERTASHRSRPLRVLFVHRDADVIDCCLEELRAAQYDVSPDFVVNLAQCAERLRSESYDVVIAEYPSPRWNGAPALQLLGQKVAEIPLLIVIAPTGSQPIAHRMVEDDWDYVEREHLAQLPMTIRRALNEKHLRQELEQARRALRHSQSLYRALVDNPAYGIYRCDAEGQLRDVNQALVNMLGYASKEELLAANQPTNLLQSLGKDSPLLQRVPETQRIDPVEIEWKRKDGTTLKARLSGRGIYDDHGNFAGLEIIAVDATEQRTLEDQLRHQASSDSLTGLANHRRLFEVLHAEICRSQRTGRGFSLVLLDLDGLKQVNDRYGHLAGDRALCRLGQILTDCCRSIDTAARHGGDEFALVLPETGVAAATLVARRICDLVASDAEEPLLSVSAGIASFPEEANTIGTLLYAADRALYAMKTQLPEATRSVRPSFSTSTDWKPEIGENREELRHIREEETR